MKTQKDSQINGAPSAVQSEGNASTILESPIEKPRACQHPFCGCMSNKGYMCLHEGPCQPLDSDRDQYFTVTYTEIDGQRLMCKTYTKLPTHSRMIDAETAQAARGIRGAAAALQNTPFGDAEPFNPGKFIQDVIGS